MHGRGVCRQARVPQVAPAAEPALPLEQGHHLSRCGHGVAGDPAVGEVAGPQVPLGQGDLRSGGLARPPGGECGGRSIAPDENGGGADEILRPPSSAFLTLQVLQWARSQDPKCPWNEDTCDGASQRGHLETLKWCRQQDPPCPWFPNEVLLNAAAGGYLDMIKVRPKTKTEIPPPNLKTLTLSPRPRQWLRESESVEWDSDACVEAAAHGHLEVLKFLRREGCPCNEETICNYARTLEVLKWLALDQVSVPAHFLFFSFLTLSLSPRDAP